MLPFSEHDECVTNQHNCDENALCFNTVGGHNCVCKPGYTGNGTICKGKLLETCIFCWKPEWGCTVIVDAVLIVCLQQDRQNAKLGTWVLHLYDLHRHTYTDFALAVCSNLKMMHTEIVASKIWSSYVSFFVSAVSIYGTAFKGSLQLPRNLVCENIVRFTLSVVSDLLFYLDELKIVWYVLLS